jgi:hypothetical protein
LSPIDGHKYLCQPCKNSILKAKPQTKRKTDGGEGGEEEEDEEEDAKSDMTASVMPFPHPSSFIHCIIQIMCNSYFPLISKKRSHKIT